MFQSLPPLKIVAQKTFVCDTADSFVAQVLKENGWKQISKSSNTWNLKWTWRVNAKQYQNLQSFQIINHFKESEEITTKLGLSLLYKKFPIILNSGKSYLSFYPRSYNLSTEKQEFMKDFYNTGILNLLKKIIVCLQLFYQPQFQQILALKKSLKNCKTNEILLRICESKGMVCPQQKQKKRFGMNGKYLLRLLFYLQNIFSIQDWFQFQPSQLNELSEYGKKDIPIQQSQEQFFVFPSTQSLALLSIYYEKCLKSISNFFQDGFSNIWIVKSNHCSRGRNIQLINDLKSIQLLDNGMKMVQKYIQNIWVLHQLTDRQQKMYPQMLKLVKKKFDIRFWVLVKSFNPLQVYIYDQAYLRLSSQSYRLDQLGKKNCHLTNFSVNWKSNSLLTEDNSFVLLSNFLKFLQCQESINVQNLMHNVHTIILETLKLAQVKEDARCFELFGFDILLDAKFNPWILQCNMSPACNPRGQLRNLAKNMTVGMLSILGLIDQSTNQWKLVFKQGSLQKENNVFQQKSLNQIKSFKNCSTHRSTGLNWRQLSVMAKKLEVNRYKIIENLHYSLQKIALIQRFFRKKMLKAQKNKDSFHFRGDSLLLIQNLCRIIKQRKSIYLTLLIKKCRRKNMIKITKVVNKF